MVGHDKVGLRLDYFQSGHFKVTIVLSLLLCLIRVFVFVLNFELFRYMLGQVSDSPVLDYLDFRIIHVIIKLNFESFGLISIIWVCTGRILNSMV